MAKLIVVSVRDRQMDAFNRPFFVPSVGLAIRSFTDEVNRKADNNPMFMHANDFELFRIGTWDEDTALFENLEPPMSIAIAANVLVKEGV